MPEIYDIQIQLDQKDHAVIVIYSYSTCQPCYLFGTFEKSLHNNLYKMQVSGFRKP